MNKKSVISLIIGVLVVGGAAAFFLLGGKVPTPAAVSGSVAIVNGEEIERADFEARVSQSEQLLSSQGQSLALTDENLRAQFEAQVLEQMIAEKLFRQEAEEQGISATNEEIDLQLATLSMQVGGEEMLTQQLASAGMSLGDFRENVRTQLLIQKFLDTNIDASLVSVTEEEITELYNSVAAVQTDVPALEEVRDEIEFQIIQQKEGEQIAALAEQLKADAEIDITL